jgi:hypothetical protein
MAEEELRGGPVPAFRGVSKARYKDGVENHANLEEEAQLQAALHNAAEYAAKGNCAGNLRVVSIQLTTTPNPHIKELRVIVTPDV